jgi:deoxyribodipyrimidine photolyase
LKAGITLGQEYPEPIVDHAQARTAALAALKVVTAAKKKA